MGDCGGGAGEPAAELRDDFGGGFWRRCHDGRGMLTHALKGASIV